MPRTRIYALLAKTSSFQQQDRAIALDSYQRSLTQWRKLEHLQGFTELRRREMVFAAAELAAFDRLPENAKN